jgi:hypothetical protein
MQAVRRNILERFRREHGKKQVARLEVEDLAASAIASRWGRVHSIDESNQRSKRYNKIL